MSLAGRSPQGACPYCGTHGAIPIDEDLYLCRGCNRSWRDHPSQPEIRTDGGINESSLGYNAEEAACERYPLKRIPDDHHDEWWLDAEVVEQIDIGDGFGTVEPGTPVDVKSAAWRIDNGGPRRGRWLLRERAHRRLLEADGEYALIVASPDDREIVACELRPAWWVNHLVTTWSPSRARRSKRRVAQIPWSRAFREVDKSHVAIRSQGASA